MLTQSMVRNCTCYGIMPQWQRCCRKPIDLASEASKHRAVSQLANTFSKLTAEHLGKKWFQHFEAWLFARRAGIKEGADMVLPVSTNSSTAHKELKRKLTAAGVARPLADSICSELDRVPAQLVDKVRRVVEFGVHVAALGVQVTRTGLRQCTTLEAVCAVIAGAAASPWQLPSQGGTVHRPARRCVQAKAHVPRRDSRNKQASLRQAAAFVR